MAATSLPIPAARQRFRRRLLSWYRAHGRDLPWRRTDDPYHILVSEIMLQQTQVDRVLPKYLEWLGKYPSLEALARRGSRRDRTAALANSRPRRLRRLARESVSRPAPAALDRGDPVRSGARRARPAPSAVCVRRARHLTSVARVLYRVHRPRRHQHKMHKQL
jgi:A/G-specific adenine glycosylase